MSLDLPTFPNPEVTTFVIQEAINNKYNDILQAIKDNALAGRDGYYSTLTVNNANDAATIIQSTKITVVSFVPTNAALSQLFPASLKSGDSFIFIDAGNPPTGLAATYNLTINSNGHKINGTVQNYVIKNNKGWVIFEYKDTNIGFTISDHSILQLAFPVAVSTNFKKVQVIDTVSIYVSDGTTPNGNLTGVTGDICYNGPSGQPFYCSSSGTTWTGM